MAEGGVLVNSVGLAVALGVSLRTVRRMRAAEEIKPIWVRGALRFHIPDVVESLRDRSRKWGRAANAEKLKAETLKAEMGGGR